MKVKVQDLKPGMLVVHTTGKGILTVADVTPWVRELFPQQYDVSFEGINAVEQCGRDEEFEVIGDDE